MSGSNKISKETAYVLLEEKHGNSITMTNYTKASAKADFRCNVCGHGWSVYANSVICKGTGCRKCMFIRVLGDRAISLEEAKNRLKIKHSSRIKLLKYTKMGEYATFECSICGYIWTTVAGSVITAGCGCDRCADRRNGDALFYSHDAVKEIFSSFGCCLLSEEYCGDDKPLVAKMVCGHIDDRISLTKLRQLKIKKCRDCRILELCALPRDVIISRVENAGFIFEGFVGEYKNNKSKIVFTCDNGHLVETTVNDFSDDPACKECRRIERKYCQVGSRGPRWRGGITELPSLLDKRLSDWKLESMKNCSYKCVVTGERFDEIHHVFPFNKILDEAISNLGFEKRKYAGEYSDDDMSKIIEEVRRLHTIYPLGVCLKRNVHALFHKEYGNKNFVPDDFYEFVERIKSGEIQIPN